MSRNTVGASALGFTALACVASLVVTGCGASGSVSTARGKVVEREEKVNKTGGTDYYLTVATDAKTNRKGKVTKKTKKVEVRVNASAFKNCVLKDRFPNCK